MTQPYKIRCVWKPTLQPWDPDDIDDIIPWDPYSLKPWDPSYRPRPHPWDPNPEDITQWDLLPNDKWFSNENKNVYAMYSFNISPPPFEPIFPPFSLFEKKIVKLSELVKSLEEITENGLDIDLDNKRKMKLEYDENKIKLEYDSGKIILEINRTKRKDHGNQTGYENKNKY